MKFFLRRGKISTALSVILGLLFIFFALIYSVGLKVRPVNNLNTGVIDILQGETDTGIKWDDLGRKMIDAQVVDPKKLEALYSDRGGLSADDKKLIYGSDNGNLKINSQNAGLILNLLWAFGLGNKNEILEKGPMADPQYGGVQNFASTAGWSLASGDPLSHYSRHLFVPLATEAEIKVIRVAKNIYRPCCNNSTYFPDCNHGMAMLGALELLASQGKSEEEMYKAALVFNSYWFPENYGMISKYLKSTGMRLTPQDILGPNFSSISGYSKILSQMTSPKSKGGSSCGV